MAMKIGDSVTVPFEINATDLAAPTNKEIVAPVTGFITELYTVVQTAIVTGGAITVEIAATPVAGLSITVADSATKGTVQSATATVGSATRAVTKGQRVTVNPAAGFNGGGAVNGFLTFQSSVSGEAALT